MAKCYSSLPIICLLFLLLPGTCVLAQMRLANQDFEGDASDDWAYTETPATYNDGGDVWAVVPSVGSINGPSSGTNFWGMQDLKGPQTMENDIDHVLAFATISTAGQSNVLLNVDYRAVGLDNGDDLSYELILDNVSQGVVLLVEGGTGGVSTSGWETLSIPIDDAVNTVALNLIANQDGGTDYAGWDNIFLQFNNAADPCGLTSVGSATIECLTESTASETDLFRIRIPYTGVDADATITVFAGATTPSTDVTASTSNVGDDPTTVTSGTIVLENSAGEFEEGDFFRIEIRDGGGDCTFDVTGNVTPNFCSNPCDININPNNFTFSCDSNTDDPDNGTVGVFFTNGPEPGLMLSISPAGPVISGDDPATEEDGSINISGLLEGVTYTLTLDGGGCSNETVTIPFPAGTCVASDLVINEVAGDPGEDINGDGSINSGDEFVELFNTGTSAIDLSNYTLADNAGVFFTFPSGASLAPGEFVVVLGATGTTPPDCTAGQSVRNGFIGINNTGGDVVVVSSGAGSIVASMEYGDFGSSFDQSVALNPDGNLAGGYVPHTSITDNPVLQSACAANGAMTLPVELTALGADAGAKTVDISWSTAAEEGNSHFLVERSADGATFSVIGRVEAAGGGRSADNHYFLVDETPLFGTSFYRLRQIDLDGDEALYGPVSVTRETGTWAVYPNPVRASLYIAGPLTATDRVTLLTAGGRVLTTTNGRNRELSVRDLTPGLYFLRVESAAGVEVLRVMKR